ncbi:aminotransferase class IV [Sedimentibacter sp. zth1]|uniref:aminotransferase class IV n=1 Tax=Sedimentibacter sp. zth1 TaxID=2816908 RepID=UPI001A9157E1|nr:aminotransferase class IV [Sedimentibacter sp. zth1]QSX06897.1 aminotransferase class IV [Sedimentibacter sp. zth1]
MANVKLSVRELVAYVYKSGDLTTNKPSVDRALEGTRIHKLLQSQMDSNYHKEYYLIHSFTYCNIDFVIEGRADGIIAEDDKITIDEIKSTYTDLSVIDKDYNLAHSSQALCYAYFYCYLENVTNATVQVRYCNIDTEEIKTISSDYTFKQLESLFYNLIDKYLDWAKLNVEHIINKRISVENIVFPFGKYREGQRDLLIAVYQTIKNKKKLFVQAPTGIGKTISVLFPAIKALNKVGNSKIYYLTSKSSTKQIAEETIKKLQQNGLKVRATIITAKEKICCNDTFKCDAEVCPYAKGYFNKINEVLINSLKTEYLYNREYIEQLAKKYTICPFELNLELSYVSDIVICDYNYYFDPRVAFQREDFLDNSNDILLVDEAHNLEDRTRNMYSCELVKEEIYDIYKEIKGLDFIDKNIKKAIRNINSEFVKLKKLMSEEKNMIIDAEPDDFLKACRKVVSKLEKWVNDKEGYNNEKLEDLYFKCKFFIKLSEFYDENYCYYISKEKGFKIKIFLINTSEILRSILKNTYSSIFFSATLTPLKYYRKILGGNEDEDKLISLNSPFDINNLKLMITGNLSMKYSIRDLNIKKICEYINTVVSIKKGNYIVFFPSYSYLSKVLEVYESIFNDELVVNMSTLKENEQYEILNKFDNENNVILFTVVGGVFSEGVNLPLNKLIGTIVIGTGIPQISFERNIIKSFFNEKYDSGYDFAYKFPGFNKVLQSVGRVIRTEDDLGMTLLIDSRLLSRTYTSLFPNHWREYNVIYNNIQLINTLKQFWKEGENIMINIVSEKNVLNGRIIDKSKTYEILENDSTRIYEVIRVINRRPTFLKEHFSRLINSIKLSNITYNIEYEQFKQYIELLINNNDFENCNIRVTFDINEKQILLMYFIKSFYPDKSYYEDGIHTVTIVKERKNPNIKKNTKTYREEIDEVLKKDKAFEAILVNMDKTISEGSKSNVFFVKDSNLITAIDSDVLLGVTRDKVIEIAKELGFGIVKRKISVQELNSFDAVFITGTSNNVLPINSIDDIIFNSSKNKVVEKLMIKYESLL